MSAFQTVLVIDTAMNGCGVAVHCAARGVKAARVQPMVRGQAEALMPLVEAVMAEAGLEYVDLDAVVVTCGPGAFTGLRIGMSAAKSIGLALNIPVFGITTLQALALGYIGARAGEGPFSVVLETKREDFYFQAFDESGKALGEALAAPADEISGQIVGPCLGDAAARLKTVSGPADLSVVEGFDLPDPAVIAQVFIERQGSSDIFAQTAVPVYLRPADVSFSKKPQRVLAQK